MSLGKMFETTEYAGSVTLGSGVITARKKSDEKVIFNGNINNLIDDSTPDHIKEIIYVARTAATGKKYL